MRLTIVCLILTVSLLGQQQFSNPADYTSYGQMIYWKSLTTPEKKVFLHAFLYRTYEIGNQVRSSAKLNDCATAFEAEVVKPILEIFSGTDEKFKDDLIFWIDKFYRQEHNRTKPFYEALLYAVEKIKTKPKSLYDTVNELLE